MDVFDLFVKLVVDDGSFKDQIGKDKGIAQEFGNSLKKGLGTAAKVAGAALVTAGAAAVALGTKAVKAYSEYEQLVGGVETLFGKSANIVQEYASNAFQTAGLSANEYMETVTSFSASLLQSLGGDTKQAADLANMAIIDMSDNANKMGTDMSSIQSAYQGFAKQNYTMLDNLKLGYGGTKSEMERLIRDAEKMDKSFSVTHTKTKKGADEITYSYADIVKAINIVQKKMGIAGTTQAEAAKTIQGSVNAAKAAWENLVVGLADDNADIDKLIDNLVDSFETASDNILPRVKKALNGITKLVTKGVQKLTPIVVDVVKENLPEIIKAGVTLLTALITGLISAIPDLVDALPEIFSAIWEALQENGPALKEAGIQLLIYIAQGIAAGLQWIGEQMVALGSAIQTWLGEAWENVKTAASEKWDQISQTVSDAVSTIREKFSEWVSAAGEKVEEFKQAIHDKLTELLTEIGQWIEENLITPARDKIEEFVDVGSQVVEKIKQGISNAWDGLTSWFNGIWDRLFGNRNVNVNVTQTGGYAIGLDYVPFNGFPAMLHRGEAVLTAREAEEWRRGNSGNGNVTTINQYIETVPQTPVELAAATAAYFEQARWAVA